MSQQSYNNAAVTLNAISSGAASFVSTKRFFDDVNFPKGFKRCGDFTNKEAELLEQHGHALKALMEGSQLPGTPDEDQFVKVSQGALAPSTTLELLWAKYTKLAKGKPFYAVVGTIHTHNKSASAAIETDIDFDDIDEGEDIDDNDDNAKD
ncbi:MaoP family protein [Shewanella gaetbuli]